MPLPMADIVALLSLVFSWGMDSILRKGGTVIMDGSNNVTVSVDTDILVKLFLKMLNNENLINNKTYLAAEAEVKKGENTYVDQK